MKTQTPSTQLKTRLALALLVVSGVWWAQVIPLPAQEACFFRIAGPVPTWITSVAADGTVTWTNQATNWTFTVQRASVLPGGSNWVDWVQVPASNAVTVHRIFDPSPPTDMAFIPAGSFTMGNALNPSEGLSHELPLHKVYLSSFWMDRYEVTKVLWDEVKAWSGSNGYIYLYAGSGKAANHPVQNMTWYDMVKWCNARSQKEGLTSCYYTDVGLTAIYKSGQLNPYVKWNANGYRLPTEAEWEKAARGGATGHRFPWSDTDTIQHSWANYRSSSAYAYDTSPTRDYHPIAMGISPYTSPVGYFAPNGYGLYDMAGNVSERCWDWYSSTNYSSSPSNDPRGPSSGEYRVYRGGGWDNFANSCRTSYRVISISPTFRHDNLGFRSVRAAGQ